METNKKEIMSLAFRVNNVIYLKSSGKIWSKYKNVIDTSRQLYYILKVFWI